MANEMREDYDVFEMKGVVQGKCFQVASVGTNLVLIELELSKLFPNGGAVNRALRFVVESSGLTAAARAKRSKRG
jgi:hypothetical protein